MEPAQTGEGRGRRRGAKWVESAQIFEESGDGAGSGKKTRNHSRRTLDAAGVRSMLLSLLRAGTTRRPQGPASRQLFEI
jgi:hypothetical protein